MEIEPTPTAIHELNPVDNEDYKQISNNFIDIIFQSAIDKHKHLKLMSQDFNLCANDHESHKLMSSEFLDNVFESAFASHKNQQLLNKFDKNEEEKTLNLHQIKDNYECLPSANVPLNSFEKLLSSNEGDGQEQQLIREISNIQIDEETSSQSKTQKTDEKERVECKKTFNNIVDLKMCIKEDSREHLATFSQYEVKHEIDEDENNDNDEINYYDNEDIETLTKAVEPDDDIEEKSMGLINLIKVEKESTDFHNDKSPEMLSANSKHVGSEKKDQENKIHRHNSSFGSSLSNIKEDNAKSSFQPSRAEVSYKAVVQYEHQEVARIENIREESRKNLLALISNKRIDEVMIENEKSLSRIEKNEDNNILDIDTDSYGISLKTERKDKGVDFEVLNDVDFDKFNRKENMVDCENQASKTNEPYSSLNIDMNKTEKKEEASQSIAKPKSTEADDYENYEYEEKYDELPKNSKTIAADEQAFQEKLQEEMRKMKETLEEEMKLKVKEIKDNIRSELREELLEEIIREGNLSNTKNDSYLVKKSNKMKEMKSNLNLSNIARNSH